MKFLDLFFKSKTPNTTATAILLATNHDHSSNQKHFQQQKSHLARNNINQASTSLMDYSKQEDRLTNNKYHYYIKHYLNNNNQIVDKSSTEILGQINTSSLPNSKSDYAVKNASFLYSDAEPAENDIEVKSNKFGKNQMENSHLHVPKVNILKNIKNRLGSGGKKRTKVIDLKLQTTTANDLEHTDSHLSFDQKDQIEVFKSDNSLVLERLSSPATLTSADSKSNSQNRQFLDKIQNVYNRKFKSNNKKIIPINESEEIVKFEADFKFEGPSSEQPLKKSLISKYARHNKNLIHPDSNLKQFSKSTDNLKYDSVSTFTSDQYAIFNRSSQNINPRVEFDFSIKKNEKSRLNPIHKFGNKKEVLLKIDYSSTPNISQDQSMIVNDFLRDIIVENLSDVGYKRTEGLKDDKETRAKSLSVIDLADLELAASKNNNNNEMSYSFKPMRLNDYIKNSKSRRVKNITRSIKLKNANRITEETAYSDSYTNPRNSVLDERLGDGALATTSNPNISANFLSNSTITLNSKKRVSFHENVLETDVNSGSSVYKLLL